MASLKPMIPLLLVAALFGGCASDDDGRCPYEGATPTNSCYYCCFAPAGASGSLCGCYSGETVTTESCQERLLEEKNCPDPVDLELLDGCQCHVDCEEPEWFEEAS